MVGMAPKNVELNGQNFNTCGWYLHVFNGLLYSQAGDASRNYTSSIRENSVILVKHNKERRTISFSIDGQDKGIAFQNIPADMDLYPYVEICHQSGALMIVDRSVIVLE